MNAKPDLTVIIPAYNEEKVIADVIADIKALKKNYEILVVDDGSTDNTYNVIKDLGIKIIRHPRNKGYGAALKTGIRSASGDIVLTMDADGQHNPEDIPRLLEHIDECDMVVGERTKGSHFSALRKPGKALLGWVANYLAGVRIPDLNSGFRVIRKELASRLLHILPNGFSFSTTITLAVIKEDYDIKYVPIQTRKRIGKSTVSYLDAFKTLMLILRIINLFSPLKVFLPMSILLGIVGIPYFLYQLIFLSNISEISVILITSSILIFFFGLLADQLAAIRRELK